MSTMEINHSDDEAEEIIAEETDHEEETDETEDAE